MSDRFDDIEDRLRRLDTIRVVSGGNQPAADGENVPSVGGASVQRRTASTASEKGHHNGAVAVGAGQKQAPAREPQVSARGTGWMVRLVSPSGSRRRRDRLHSLEDQAIIEGQERLREAVECVVEDARRQLESLARELVPSFRVRMEKSIEDSVRTITEGLVESLAHHREAVLQRVSTVGQLANEPGHCQASQPDAQTPAAFLAQPPLAVLNNKEPAQSRTGEAQPQSRRGAPKSPAPVKAPSNAPNWRILGLNGGSRT